MSKQKPTRGALERAFHEVSHDEPAVVGSTRKKFGAERANKQRVAIALSKARRGYAAGGPVMPGGMDMQQMMANLPALLKRAPPQVADAFQKVQLLARNAMPQERRPTAGEFGSKIMNPVQAMGRMSPNLQRFASRGIQRAFNKGGPIRYAADESGHVGYDEGGPVLGGQGIIAKRKQYQAYVNDMQEQGESPVPFPEWLHEQISSQTEALGGEAGTEAPAQAEPLLDVIMNKLRSFKLFAGGGQVGPDPKQFMPEYYLNNGRDMFPPETAALAARMAQDRALRQAMGAGGGADARERLNRLRSLIARIRGVNPTAGALMDEEPEVGSRADLFRRMRPEKFAMGGSVHHVPPRENYGFTHETDDGFYTYADGGAVPGGIPAQEAGLPPEIMQQLQGGGGGGPPQPGPGGMPPPPPQGGPQPGPNPQQPSAAAGFEQSMGALATLGKQLLAERAALQNTYQIPPPGAGMGGGGAGGPPGGAMAPPPGPSPAAAPPGGAGPMPPGAGGPPPMPGQQQTQPPGFARGGPISSRVMQMAGRDPRMAAKLCKCGGGHV